MELTQLRNAFDLNRDVLAILSGKTQPSLRHFYFMLKKLNQHVIDLADNQFRARKQRYRQTEEYQELELKYHASTAEICALKQRLDAIEHDKKEQQREHVQQYVISPKQSYMMLTQQIKKISNELFELGNTCSKLKAQNRYLKHSKDDRPEHKRFRDQVDQVSQQESDSEDSGSNDLNKTVNYTKSYNTSRRTTQKNKQPKRLIEEGSENLKRNKYLQIQLQMKDSQISRLKRSYSELNEKFAMLSNIHKKVSTYNRTCTYEQSKRRSSTLIGLIQWRFEMQMLEEVSLLKALTTSKELRGKSL